MSDHESPEGDSACLTSVESSLARGVPWKTASIVAYVPTHEYQPLLSKQHTRRLVPEPGTGDDSLIGSLEMIDLGSAADLAPFEAISYVWGSKIKCQTITIDGRRLAIIESLSQALRGVVIDFVRHVSKVPQYMSVTAEAAKEIVSLWVEVASSGKSTMDPIGTA
ncbi:hypothetical protein Daus18300_001684 [Diaporthe australafricana]|uniref:Heterokaryon incompatibility domain-containing protein n=1 Tax=Diaporthe australafricana TaxID=127596 RepID=A0ABR3XW22_9PEZI